MCDGREKAPGTIAQAGTFVALAYRKGRSTLKNRIIFRMKDAFELRRRSS